MGRNPSFFLTALREKAISRNSLNWTTNDICFFSHSCEGRLFTASKRNSIMSAGLSWQQALKTLPKPWTCPWIMSSGPHSPVSRAEIKISWLYGGLLSLFCEAFYGPPTQNYSIFCEFQQKNALLRAFYYVLPISVSLLTEVNSSSLMLTLFIEAIRKVFFFVCFQTSADTGAASNLISLGEPLYSVGPRYIPFPSLMSVWSHWLISWKTGKNNPLKPRLISSACHTHQTLEALCPP